MTAAANRLSASVETGEFDLDCDYQGDGGDVLIDMDDKPDDGRFTITVLVDPNSAWDADRGNELRNGVSDLPF